MPRKQFQLERLTVCTQYFLATLATLRAQQAKMDRVLVTVNGLIDFMVMEWKIRDSETRPGLLEPREYSEDVIDEYIVYALYKGSNQEPNYTIYAFVQVVDRMYTLLLGRLSDYRSEWGKWITEWHKEYEEEPEYDEMPDIWPYWIDGKVIRDPAYTASDLEEEFRMWQAATVDIRREYEKMLTVLDSADPW